jgi:CHAD domain-containing protein
MRALPSDLLDCPAPEGARRLALAALRAVVRARKRLDAPGDVEALHDFRVALRKLRSVLRAYRPMLDDAVPHGVRRRLAAMAVVAGECRDDEVRLRWLHEQRDRMENADLAGFAWVERSIRREGRASARRLQRMLHRDFAGAVRKLRHGLGRHDAAAGHGKGRPAPTTGEMISGTLLRATRELRARLAVPTRAGDARALHRARIAAKRLRYAIEPLSAAGSAPAAVVEVARLAVAQLGLLQDELGLLNDAHVFRRWLRERLGISPPPAAAGYGARALDRLLRAQTAASYEIVRGSASRRGVRRVLRAIRGTARALVQRPRAGDTFSA